MSDIKLLDVATPRKLKDTLNDIVEHQADPEVVAANTAARHGHTNKAILDNTTAAYTTEDKAHLNSLVDGGNCFTMSVENGDLVVRQADVSDVQFEIRSDGYMTVTINDN